LFFVVIFFILSYEGGKVLNIAVFDESGILANRNIPSSKDGSIHYIKTTDSLADLKKQAQEEKYSAVLKLPTVRNIQSKDYTITYYSESDPGLEVVDKIEGTIKNIVRDYKMEKLELDKEQLKLLDTKIILDPDPLDDTKEDSSRFSGVVGAMLGGLMGFLMYFVVIAFRHGRKNEPYRRSDCELCLTLSVDDGKDSRRRRRGSHSIAYLGCTNTFDVYGCSLDFRY